MCRQEDFLISEAINENQSIGLGRVKESKLASNYMIEKETPTKCKIIKQSFALNCQIQFIDFEGRSDGESVQKILEQVRYSYHLSY